MRWLLFVDVCVMMQRDFSMEDPREVEASKSNLNYIGLDGEIGCMGTFPLRTLVCSPLLVRFVVVVGFVSCSIVVLRLPTAVLLAVVRC